MSKKPKRIRAVKAHIDQKGCVATTWEAVRDDTPYEPCYILRQSDIRALAGRMVQKMDAWKAITGGREHIYAGDVLEGFKAIGITPGKERAK